MNIRNIGVVLSTALLLSAGCNTSVAQTPEEIAAIQAALPAKATAKAAKPRKVLVFSLATGFKHASIPYGEKALEEMGKKSGAFTATISRDMASFEPENLKQFDAVIFNNTTGELFTTHSLRMSLMDFVNSGKGVAGIHAASDTNFEWGEFGNLIGGYFNGHPWTADSTVVLKIEEPKHPVNESFGGEPFTVKDEIYQFKEPYSRLSVRVLTSLDPTKTDMTKKGMARADSDYPVSWVHNFGKGRVFYCSLGHNKEIYANSTVLQHYLDGIQFALGDLKADAIPRKDEAISMLNDTLPAMMSELSTFETHVPNRSERLVQTLVQQSANSPSMRRILNKRLAELAVAKDAKSTSTFAARQFAFEQLMQSGRDEDATNIAPAIYDEDERIANVAARTLSRIPGRAAGQELIQALDKTSGNVKLAMINGLGERKEGAAVKALSAHTLSTDQQTADAAITALAKIGTPDAATTLERLAKTGQPNLHVEEALVRAAEGLADKGNRARAGNIYRSILEKDTTSVARMGAFRGLISIKDTKAKQLALDAIVADDTILRQVAMGALLQKDSIVSTQEILRRIASAPPAVQVALIEVLGGREDIAAMKPLVDMANSETSSVKVAALKALGSVGDGSVVPLLVKTAASAESNAQAAARDALKNLKSAAADEAIVSALATTDNEDEKVELASAAGERRIKAAVPELLKNAGNASDKLKIEAVKALALSADKEAVEPLSALLPGLTTNRLRTEIEKAITAAAKSAGDEKQQAELVDTLLEKAPDDASRASLLKVLGKIADDRTLARLKKVRSESTNETLSDAAIRALADYPSAAAMDDVRDIAKSSSDEVHRGLAVQGYARMLSLKKDMSTSETVFYSQEALQLAKTADQKKAVLGALGELDKPGVFQLLVPYVNDPDLKEEAQLAALNLAPGNHAFAPDTVTSAIQTILDTTTNAERKKTAQKVLRSIKKTAGTIMGWQVAGPFTADANADLKKLMEQEFPPETEKPGSIQWRLLAAGKNKKKPEMVDLKEALEGDNRVAYMRVGVWSPDERKVRLALGSDDAIRVWLNDTIIHKTDSTRAYKKAADTVDATLRKGWNNLMLKIGQGDGDWGASAMLSAPDGKKMDDIKIDATLTEFPLEVEPVQPVATAETQTATTGSVNWVPLFNGENLDGWEQRGGKAIYKVENGELVGSSATDRNNTFLCTKQQYANFLLELECKLDGPLNSGVQIRSHSRPEKGIDRVYGYQVEIDPTPRAWSGGLYEEGGRLWLYDLKENEPGRKAFKLNDWNKYRIEAVGDTFRTWVNGVQCVAAVDSLTTSGFIGLQVHGTTSTVPISVRWRNIRIQELEAPAAANSLQFTGDWKSTDKEKSPVYAQVVAQGNNELSATLVNTVYTREPAHAVADGKVDGDKAIFTGPTEAILEANAWFKGKTAGIDFDMKKIARISPTLGMNPPDGATVLLDGKNLDQWSNAKGEPLGWKLVDGAMEIAAKAGNAQTRKSFGDALFHMEFRTPFMPDKRGQQRGNSGVYVQGAYEIQVLDSYALEGIDNECGGIYKVGPPRVNMCLPPMEWQTYDIVFEAAKFAADGSKQQNARLTVYHNGVCIHAQSESANATPGGLIKEDPKQPMPMMLQDHGNPVQFRNIWALDLQPGAPELAAKPKIIK